MFTGIVNKTVTKDMYNANNRIKLDKHVRRTEVLSGRHVEEPMEAAMLDAGSSRNRKPWLLVNKYRRSE